MKKLYAFLIIFLVVALNSYGQNNAPIALNDTIYVTFNDSIQLQQIANGTPRPPFMANDTDLDGNLIYIDTAFYNGLGTFKDTLIAIIPTISVWRAGYKPPINYVGLDSIQYVIKDNGVPVMYDTATIYLFVKNKEFENLNLNNINARVDHRGLFRNMVDVNNNNVAAFEVPKGSHQNTIFAANLWVTGKNQDSIYSNSDTYNAQLTYGRSGPLMDSIYYNYNYSYKWDRVWKVTNNEIQYHINNWNQPNYQPPQVFLDWPAQGDTSKGQAFYLAPFVDNNNDGIYNPYDGDYPKIKGQQAVYFIYNDMREKYSNHPMRSEVHGMAYAYNCPSDSAINNTIFLDYTIYNRSNLTYDSTYIGTFTDFDIGNSEDDYAGCDVARSTYYGYNGDDFDEDNAGVLGYQAYPPAQGVTFLKGAKQDNDGIDNAFGIALDETVNGLGFGDGIVDNEYWGMEHFMSYNRGGGLFAGDGDPISDKDFYNYLTGRWKDGAHLVYGLNGHPATGGTVPAKYLYPSNTDPLWYGTGGVATTPTNWSEINAAIGGTPNTPFDRRGEASTGPFTFYPDSSITITLAFVFGRDYQTTGNQAGIVVMQTRVDSIRSYFATDFVSVCGGALSVSEHKIEENNLIIYPNPFNNEITINYKLKSKVATLEVYSLMGKKIITKTITKNTTKINLSNLATGIYFLKVSDGNTFITRKVIKQ